MSNDPQTRILEFSATQATIFQTMQTTLTNLLLTISALSLSDSDRSTLITTITSLQKNTSQASTERDGIDAFASQRRDSGAEELVRAQGALAEATVQTQAITTSLSYLGHLANQIAAASALPLDAKAAMEGNVTSAQDAAGAALQSGSGVQGNLAQLVQLLGGTVGNGSGN